MQKSSLSSGWHTLPVMRLRAPLIPRHEDRVPVLIAVVLNLALILFIPQKFQLLPIWVVRSSGRFCLSH